MDILNRCSVDYSYRLSATSPMVKKTILSNIASTQIIRERLEVKKFVNKENASSFDILIYTITIFNISEELVENLFFKDGICKNTKFIENSVTINDIKRRGLNPEKGFCIGNVLSRDNIKITFKVLILNSCLSKYIKNQSSVIYNYIYNIEKPPIRISKESNNVITNHDNNLFKQILVRSIIKTHTKIDCIKNINYNVEIIKTKIINSHILNLCKLLIFGKLKYKIYYYSKGYMRYCEKVFVFSESMLVPIGISYLSKIDIKLNVEYSCSKLINNNTIFINNVMLIYI